MIFRDVSIWANIDLFPPDWWAPKDVCEPISPSYLFKCVCVCVCVCVCGLEGFDDLESEVQEIQNWQTR